MKKEAYYTGTVTSHETVPVFSLAERDRRWELARTFMEERGLDAILVIGEHEDSGPASYSYDTWLTNTRPGTTVLLPKKGLPLNLVPAPMFALDHLEAGDEAWIPAENVRFGRHSLAAIQAIQELGLEQATIGVLGLEPFMPWHVEGIIAYNFWSRLTSELSNVTFRSVGAQFAPLLMVQSEEEIAVLKHAAQIGESMIQAMVEAARPGVSESEVYAAGMAAAFSSGTIVPWMHMCSGHGNLRFGPPSWGYRPGKPRLLTENDYIKAEVFSNFGSSGTQHQFSLTLGEVPAEIEKASVVARSCYEAGLRKLRPGTKFGEVVEAMTKPVEAAQGWVRGPQIHGINPLFLIGRIPANHIQIPELDRYSTNMQGGPTLLPELELTPGMSFVFEPSCGFGRHLVTLGGTVLVGEDGAIELNPSTGNLIRKE